MVVSYSHSGLIYVKLKKKKKRGDCQRNHRLHFSSDTASFLQKLSAYSSFLKITWDQIEKINARRKVGVPLFRLSGDCWKTLFADNTLLTLVLIFKWDTINHKVS